MGNVSTGGAGEIGSHNTGVASGNVSGDSSNSETPGTEALPALIVSWQGMRPDSSPLMMILPMRMILHMEYGFGVGGMVIQYLPYLLLNDGNIYKHVEVSPYHLDVPRSQQVEKDRWGVWKLDGQSLIIKMNGKAEADRWEKNWFWAPPAAKNEKMSGTWLAQSGCGNAYLGGGSTIVSTNQLSFNEQGQFTTAGHTSGVVHTGGFGYVDATGSATAYSNKEGAGTYILDGYYLELRYYSGEVVRKSFCFYPNSKDSKECWSWGTCAYMKSN